MAEAPLTTALSEREKRALLERYLRERADQPLDGAAEARPRSAAPADRHPFEGYVNPSLGAVLRGLKLDKRYVRGEGCWLEDAEGRRYLDFMAAYGALPFGHNPPEIWDA